MARAVGVESGQMVARNDDFYEYQEHKEPAYFVPTPVASPNVFADVFSFIDKFIEAMSAGCLTSKSDKCDKILDALVGLKNRAAKFAEKPVYAEPKRVSSSFNSII